MQNLKTQNLKTIGRIIFGLPFIVFGANHVMELSVIASYVPSWIPFPQIWVIVTGIIFVLAGLAIVSGRQTYWASVILAALLLILIVLVQLPGLPGTMVNFLKDTALLGAAIMLAGMHQKETGSSTV